MSRAAAVVLGVCCVWTVAVAFAEEKKFTAVDLKTHFNHKLGNPADNEIQGNDMPLMPGEQVLDGVKMEIGDRVIQLGSKLLGGKPEKVEGIAVERKLTKLHILHATTFGRGAAGDPRREEDDTFIASYRINYDDDSSESLAIEYGKDVRDWWYRDNEKEASRSNVVWKGENALSRQYNSSVRLYRTTWNNPKPDQKIVSIDILSRKDEAVASLFCVAITAEEE
jgi:hypothetical protein